jgi:hypothetical protein
MAALPADGKAQPVLERCRKAKIGLHPREGGDERTGVRQAAFWSSASPFGEGLDVDRLGQEETLRSPSSRSENSLGVAGDEHHRGGTQVLAGLFQQVGALHAK